MKPNREFTLWNVLLAVVALFAVFACTLHAADPTEGIVTKIGTDSPGATNEVAIWYPSGAGQAIKLTSFQAVGDNADAVFAMYGGEARTTLSSESSGTLTVASTNLSIAAGDVIVVIDSDGDTGWGFVSSTGSGTVVLDRDPGTFTAGSIVWAMTKKALTTVGNATVTRDAYALFAAKKRSPLMVRFYTAAGTTETIKYATAEYYDPD